MEQVYEWGTFELILGTWAFRDLSVAFTHKQRIGGGDIRGVVGLGLWGVVAFPPDENTGFALVARRVGLAVG